MRRRTSNNGPWIVAVLFWLVATQTVQAQTQENQTVELVNGSMELIEDEKPAGWNISGPDSFELSLDTGNAFEGQSCAVIHSPEAPAAGASFGNLSQSFDVTPWRGKTVRFRAAVRVSEAADAGRAQLWFRVDGKPSAGRANTVAFDNMQDRPIVSREWKHYDITSKIPDNSERLIVGILTFPKSITWIAITPLPMLLAQESEQMSEEEYTQLLEKTYEEADYVLVGRVQVCKPLGSSSSGSDPANKKWFYRLTVSPGENLSGDFLADSKKAMDDAGLDFPDDWNFQSLYMLDEDSFSFESDRDCLVVLNRVKASSMAGVIPVTIVRVQWVTEDELALAKRIAAEREKADK